MKRRTLLIILGFLVVFPSFVHSQPINPLEKIFERLGPGPRIHPSDLRVLQLDMSPDPVIEGQRVRFEATISNLSHYSTRMSLFIKDRDEVVTSIQDVLIQSGHNRIVFPQTGYRFSRHDHCFTVEVDIERNRRPIDVVKEFCVRRTYAGWSLKEIRIGPLFIEDLDMIPDPAMHGQEIRFRARVRNDGSPFRGSIRIQDRDEAVVSLNDVTISSGYTEYYFPYTRYAFQRFDHCFAVIVDVERTPHRTDAAREFCAKPAGWTLKP
jgi:hypothetical protein